MRWCPASHRYFTQEVADCNWWQALQARSDTAHVPFSASELSKGRERNPSTSRGIRPIADPVATDYALDRRNPAAVINIPTARFLA